MHVRLWYGEVRKTAAGVVVGLIAALIVLGFEGLFVLFTDGTRLTPLQTIELKTYDWRLARTARPADARQDIVLVDIDEYSLRNLQPYVGRWPWPRQVHAAMVDHLAAARARVVAYDVNFAGADSNRSYTADGETITGDESDRELVRPVQDAGNVILLADATYDATAGATPALPGAEFPILGAGVLERKVVVPPYESLAVAAIGVGQNLFILDPDGPIRHTVPFVKTGIYAVPSLGVAAALRAAGIAAADVRLDGDRLVLGDRSMPMAERRLKTEDGVIARQWALINFRGPALSPDLTSRTYRTYSSSTFCSRPIRTSRRLTDPCFATRSCSSAPLPPGCSTRSKRRLPTARCQASTSMRRWPTTSSRTGSCVGPPTVFASGP
ncbi:MAG: CHASE2 domain-containing protein [Luteitalea sp.]|nr:CHASE2 domain-containing protein [Luteitalea sp.]